jgi:hypothetical protein
MVAVKYGIVKHEIALRKGKVSNQIGEIKLKY